MVKENQNEDLEDKLIEDLEDDSEGGDGGGKKLLMIGGVVAVVLVVLAIVLSLFGGKSNTGTNSNANKEGVAADATKAETETKPSISYNDDFSRDPNSETAQKAGEPATAYPDKTSGARVPVDKQGNSIEGMPIQKSLMIDDRENPFRSMNTIAGDIYDLMEINLYSSSNKALTLGEFVGRARIEMPQDLLNKVESSYRVLMYRGSGEKGPGSALIFSTLLSKEETDNLMKEWEKTMVNNLRPFVLIGLKKDFVEASGKKDFGSSSLFAGGRYVDFSQNGIVSLNYVVSGKYIVIANSRSSFEKAISLVEKK